MELVSLGKQSVQENENSDLKATGPPGWGLDIGLTALFRKNIRVTETATKEVKTTECDELPESSQDTHTDDSGES